MPKQVGNKKSKKVCSDRLLLANLSNFIILTFVYAIVIKYFCEAVLRPLACCARRQLPPSVTPLDE